MSDRDVAKLIVVKQSRARRPEGPAESRTEEASVISDGLHYFERELQVILFCVNRTPTTGSGSSKAC